MKDSVEDYLPETGWLADFMRFTNELEACPRFRFFSACCVLGAAVNNRVWLQRGDPGLIPKMMPNLWVVLVAPPYRGHKTSCINMATNLLLQAHPHVRVLANKLTPEAIVHALATPMDVESAVVLGPTDATGLIQAPEMGLLFGRQQYNVGMIQLITDLSDFREVWRSETIHRGKEVLHNVCISVIAGSTPKWLRSALPPDAFTGGFMRRFTLVELPALYYKRKALPKAPTDLHWEKLVRDFTAFSEVSGQMEMTEEAEAAYVEYYENFVATGDEQLDSYREALIEHILRLAMILTINEGSLRLEKRCFEQAKCLIEAIMPETIMRIESLSTHPRMSVVQSIKEVLLTCDSMHEYDLLERVYKQLSQGERQFYEALSILRRTGDLEISGKFGNFVYSLTEKGRRSISCGRSEGGK